MEETAVAASGFVVAIRRSLNNELTSSAADSIFLFTFNGPSLSPISLSSSSSCFSFPCSKKLSTLDYSPNAGSKAYDPPALLHASDQTCLIDLNKQASTCPQSIPPHKIAASKREREKRFQSRIFLPTFNVFSRLS